jgi:hypothetical protein
LKCFGVIISFEQAWPQSEGSRHTDPGVKLLLPDPGTFVTYSVPLPLINSHNHHTHPYRNRIIVAGCDGDDARRTSLESRTRTTGACASCELATRRGGAGGRMLAHEAALLAPQAILFSSRCARFSSCSPSSHSWPGQALTTVECGGRTVARLPRWCNESV